MLIKTPTTIIKTISQVMNNNPERIPTNNQNLFHMRMPLQHQLRLMHHNTHQETEQTFTRNLVALHLDLHHTTKLRTKTKEKQKKPKLQQMTAMHQGTLLLNWQQLSSLCSSNSKKFKRTSRP